MIDTLFSDSNDTLNYEMLYKIFNKIDKDLKGLLEHETQELMKLFKHYELQKIPVEKAVVENTERISSYANTAMFYTRHISSKDI